MLVTETLLLSFVLFGMDKIPYLSFVLPKFYFSRTPSPCFSFSDWCRNFFMFHWRPWTLHSTENRVTRLYNVTVMITSSCPTLCIKAYQTMFSTAQLQYFPTCLSQEPFQFGLCAFVRSSGLRREPLSCSAASCPALQWASPSAALCSACLLHPSSEHLSEPDEHSHSVFILSQKFFRTINSCC